MPIQKMVHVPYLQNAPEKKNLIKKQNKNGT